MLFWHATIQTVWRRPVCSRTEPTCLLGARRYTRGADDDDNDDDGNGDDGNGDDGNDDDGDGDADYDYDDNDNNDDDHDRNDGNDGYDGNDAGSLEAGDCDCRRIFCFRRNLILVSHDRPCVRFVDVILSY